MIKLTIFKSIFDNKTHRQLEISSFDGFEKFLYDLSEKPIRTKKDAVLISPAIYLPNTTRSNNNVMSWSGWCCVDVDEYEAKGDLKDDLINRFSDYRFICYSTASSTRASPKFRLVFPLTHSVTVDKIKQFWYGLQSELGDLADKQTKDLSRMYYIPATYDNAFNFIFSNNGDIINPDDIIKKYPMPEKANLNNFFDRLPEALKEEVIKYKKNKADNDYAQWNSYRDCPFWPRNLASEYQTISKTGWYHKMYQIMVAIAGNAVKNKYAISADQIVVMCREFDIDTGNWYKNRPMEKEADRAIEYVWKNL